MPKSPKTVPIDVLRKDRRADPGEKKVSTDTLVRNPSLLPETKSSGMVLLEDSMVVVFQFLPSGSCVSFPLDAPLVVGRTSEAAPSDFLDLNPYNAEQHGVSRQHCRFWRQDQRLIVVDLDSTNGTYLNAERLIPQQPYQINHNTRLILGTLHMLITFM